MSTGSNVDEREAMLSSIDFIFSLPQELRNPRNKKPGYHQTSRDKKQEQEDAIMQELGERVYQVKVEWARKLYHDLATDEQVMKYVRMPNSGYNIDKKKWEIIPSEPADALELVKPLVELLSHVIAYFYPSLPPGVSRSAVDSHDLGLIHDNGKHASRPDISIKATGPSFEVPPNANQSKGLGYTNMAAAILVRTDKEKGDRMLQASQLAISSRQIFFQQPNRHFVRSLMVTQNHVRLVHFDRSGTYVTPLIDIHREKEVFVRLILGLSSPDEEVLGLDTSIQWAIDDATGEKTSGTIAVDEYDEEQKTSKPVVYDLNMDEPPLIRPNIRGRGTVGWNATHPITHEAVLIKDAWRSDTRTSEVEHLRAALGVPGVVEMLAYQDFCALTSSYRPPKFKAQNFHQRIKLRIVLKKYGSSLWHFKSRLELLQAFLDAFIGHKELFDRGTLHRDVSTQNILFGVPNAPDGRRGVLIDLDAAIRTVNKVSTIAPTPLTGTRLYQSVSVLRGLSTKPTPPQDYMDDLESFFYVLCHIVFLFVAPDKQQAEVPHFLRYWLNEDFEVIAALKSGSILSPLPFRQMAPYWGKPFITLLKAFQEVLVTILESKADIREDWETDDNQKIHLYTELSKDVDVYFGKVKAALVAAIAQLEEEGLSPEERKLVPNSSPLPAAPSPLACLEQGVVEPAPSPDEIVVLPRGGKKRTSEDVVEDGTPRKRRREPAQPTNSSHLGDDTKLGQVEDAVKSDLGDSSASG